MRSSDGGIAGTGVGDDTSALIPMAAPAPMAAAAPTALAVISARRLTRAW